MSKKILAMLMAVAMAFSLLPVTAFAAQSEGTSTQEGSENGDEGTSVTVSMDNTFVPLNATNFHIRYSVEPAEYADRITFQYDESRYDFFKVDVDKSEITLAVYGKSISQENPVNKVADTTVISALYNGKEVGKCKIIFAPANTSLVTYSTKTEKNISYLAASQLGTPVEVSAVWDANGIFSSLNPTVSMKWKSDDASVVDLTTGEKVNDTTSKTNVTVYQQSNGAYTKVYAEPTVKIDEDEFVYSNSPSLSVHCTSDPISFSINGKTGNRSFYEGSTLSFTFGLLPENASVTWTCSKEGLMDFSDQHGRSVTVKTKENLVDGQYEYVYVTATATVNGHEYKGMCKELCVFAKPPTTDTSVSNLEGLKAAINEGKKAIAVAGTIELPQGTQLDLSGITVYRDKENKNSVFEVSEPNVAIKGSGGVIDGQYAKAEKPLISVNKGGALTLTGITLQKSYNTKLKGGAIAVNEDGTLSCDGVKFDSNTVKGAKKDNPQTGGAAIYAYKSVVNVANSEFLNNEALYCNGGAVYFDIDSSGTFQNNTVTNCRAITIDRAEQDMSSGFGGAIFCRNSATVELLKNNITNCSAARGGGISVMAGTNTFVTIDQNMVKNCTATYRGGGLSLINTTQKKQEARTAASENIQLKSGEISECSALWGGGIDYTRHDMSPLKLQNVLITNNTAVRGAGIWACPTSEVTSYATLGGAIYDNHASGTTSALSGSLNASGDDIRYEGKNCEDEFALRNNPPSETTIMTVMKRALGGGLMQWYSDATNDRYEEGDPEADSEVYTGTNKSFGLHGELSDTYQTLAKSEAKLIISGNSAKRGGGIATNSPVVIGLEDADVSVVVEKMWPVPETEPEVVEQVAQDAQTESHPTEVKVDLYRVNADGTEIKLDSDVVLNETNDWKATFTDLPSQYVDAAGKVQKCTYTVKEQTVKGWQCSTESSLDGNTYHIHLTNTPAQLGDLKVSKTVTGSGSTTQDFTFTVTLSDQNLNGTFGDMTFTNGVATFTLKHNESKTATGLNAGTTYTVTESNNAGYTVTKTGDTGTIEKDKIAEAAFTNYKSSGGGSGGSSRPSLNTKDHYGYIIGYPVDYYTGQPTTDQTKKPVRPEGKITRAEVATIYFRMLTDESRTKFWSQSNSYSDVKAGDWFNNAVSTLSNAGIITGYEDGSFRPNGYITRAEFATIAARFFDVTYNGKDLFPDISGHWAKDYINQAANKGFVNGYEDGTFKPDRNITRAEAVTLVNRTLDRHPDKNHFTKDMLVWPDNMDQTKWYYADMQEATNSHTYQMKENSDKTKYENWTKTLPIRNWEALEKAWSNANSSQGNGNVV